MTDTTCAGCAHRQRRYRSTTPRYWCMRYHRLAEAKCIDYRRERTLIESAIQFYKVARPQ